MKMNSRAKLNKEANDVRTATPACQACNDDAQKSQCPWQKRLNEYIIQGWSLPMIGSKNKKQEACNKWVSKSSLERIKHQKQHLKHHN
jgi:hypothetical protein